MIGQTNNNSSSTSFIENAEDFYFNLTKKEDVVNHPKHYKAVNGLEAIDVIEAFTAKLKGIQATDTGNILKYMLRWHEKNGLEDLKKAQWYLNHLINKVEKENKNYE